MKEILSALRGQQEQLDGILAGLDAGGWDRPSPCPGRRSTSAWWRAAAADPAGLETHGTDGDAVLALPRTYA